MTDKPAKPLLVYEVTESSNRSLVGYTVAAFTLTEAQRKVLASLGSRAKTLPRGTVIERIGK